MNIDQTLLIIAVPAAMIHVAEEYKYGWVSWSNAFISGITIKQFIVINAMFVILCIIAAISSRGFIAFSSSIFSLFLINSLVHIAPAIKQKQYSPGLLSAVFLFIPIGVVGYTSLLAHDLLSLKSFMFSILLGLLWMSIPFVYQILRAACGR
ncbi:MAG TPA: HXXEE domain-containing protein [Dissulfurispiraceae bacterium]|nr:HXXEE domain-containing protein [Dissulfurispiraceae bacterium]